MGVKLIVPNKKKNLQAKDVPVGHICRKDVYGSISLRTKTKLFFFSDSEEVPIEKCQDTYEDLGPLEIEFSDS